MGCQDQRERKVVNMGKDTRSLVLMADNLISHRQTGRTWSLVRERGMKEGMLGVESAVDKGVREE